MTVDQTTAQISHEALLRAWPRLRRWIEDDRAGLVTRQQLTDAADAWNSAGRAPEYCYRGRRLVAADDWLGEQRHARMVRPLDREFIAASQVLDRAERLREQRQLKDEKRRTRELRQALEREQEQAENLRQAGLRLRRQARRLRQFSGVIGAILCLALVAAGVALQQRSTARANGEQAQNRQLQAAARAGIGTDPRAALLLAVAAYRDAPSSQTRDTLMDVLSGTQYAGSLHAGNWVESMAYGDDGRTLAVGRYDGVVGLWDASRDDGESRKLAEVVAKEPGILGKTALWFGDGTSLLLMGADDEKSVGAFSLAADRGRPQPRGRHALPMEGFVEQAEFSPDGRLLMTSSSYETRLWSVDPGRGAVRARATFPQRESNVQAAAFGPGGSFLVLAWQDGTVELWDIRNPGRPRSLGTLEGTAGPARAMAVSSDGNTLAVGSGDAQVRLWDISAGAARGSAAANRRPTAVVSGHGGPVEAVALSRDGRHLALGSTDHSATVWDVSGARPTRSAVLSGHATTVSALAFAPDGRTLATGDRDGDVRFWSLTDRLLPTVAARPFTVPASDYYRWLESGVPHVLSPDGRMLAVATADDQLGLIPLTGLSAGHRAGAVRLEAGREFRATAMWFSTDGGWLAAEGPAGVLTVWNVRDPARPKQEFRFRAGAAGGTYGLKVSIRDGLMATGSKAGTTLWDLSRPGRPERLGSVKQKWKHVPDVLLAPNDPVLAVDGALVDVSDPRKPEWLSALPSADGSRPYPTPHAFSPDGTRLVVTEFFERGGFLYDVSDPARPRFRGHLPQGSARGPYAFSADGRLLTGTGSGTRLLAWDVWDPTAPHPVATLTLDDDASALGISSDGATLTTYNYPGQAVRWSIAQLGATLRDPVARACRLAAANPTLAEWERMAPGVPFRRVCPTLTPAPSPAPTGIVPTFPVRPTPLPAGN
ncbi:hypothetical protein [Streptomyces sp. NPDC058667]|uniref:nSTAND1 domain-containing NTPase n=1 Tax=Streptomyces sp. NPDC058667 TaxID=3346588 RepID=UPI00365BB1F7